MRGLLARGPVERETAGGSLLLGACEQDASLSAPHAEGAEAVESGTSARMVPLTLLDSIQCCFSNSLK